jgi:hypothetical protein
LETISNFINSFLVDLLHPNDSDDPSDIRSIFFQYIFLSPSLKKSNRDSAFNETSSIFLTMAHPEEWHCHALHNCNGIPGNREPAASALNLSQAFHQPICSASKHVNVHIGHRNLNDKSLDNDVEMEHRYFFCYTLFLDASTHLYKRLCPSVRRSVGPWVRGSGVSQISWK